MAKESTRQTLSATAITAVAGLLFTAGGYQPALATPEGDVHFKRALEYELQQNVDAAAAEYKRGLEADPSNVPGRDNYGLLLLNERGDVDAAISQFVTALSADPACTYCQTHLNEAVALRNSKAAPNVDRGNNLYRTGDLVRAAAAYRIAVYTEPENAEAHNSLAWTLYRLGRLPEAMTEVKRALQLNPEDPEYINTLACVLFDQGQCEAAVEQFQKAIAKSKKANPADLYGMAVGLLAQGDRDKAIGLFRQALENDPNFADAKYLRDKIGMSVHTLASHDTLLTLSGWKPAILQPSKK